MKNIIVVDTKLLAYDTFHRHDSIFTMITDILRHCRDISNPKIVFAFDAAGGSRKRRELYPGYKANRKVKLDKQSPVEKARHKQFINNYYSLKYLLPYFGSVVSLDGYEADDIANIVCARFGGEKGTHIYMLSSDKDWASNFTYGDNITQIHLKKGIITPDMCERTYELSADVILPYQALVGVEKENVKGVYRLGKKTFLTTQTKCENFSDIIDSIEEDVEAGKNGMRLPEGYSSVRELYEFNWKILAPIEISELTDEELSSFITAFNSKEAGTLKDLEEVIFDKFGTFHTFNREVLGFFKIAQ